MKYLHITNEFTKKNFSLSSLILYISEFLYKNKNEYSILTSYIEDELFNRKNIQIIFKKWFDFLLKKKILEEKLLQYNIVHIHGLWAPIQFISLLICIKKRIKCIIHPHGMLLDEAIQSTSLIKLILKNKSFYLGNIIKGYVNFISITNQETKAIKKYFPETNVVEIPNPIPFEIKELKNNNKKRKMVYFGRIHPHKNVHLMINAFLKLNLDKNWKLEIYGIRDDEKYYQKLKKLINNSGQIEIKNPVFGEKKQDIMRESWVNILVSKSEVLSLSILESAVHELPSLVNNKIETKGFEDSIFSTDTSIRELTNNLRLVSEWKKEDRLAYGVRISEQVKKKVSIETIQKKYENIYKDIISSAQSADLTENETLFSFFKNNFNFLLVSGGYMFNLMFSAMLVIIMVALGYYSIAGELGLIISFWITVTQIFSSNMRSIIVSEENKKFAEITMIYRFAFSLIALILFYIITSNYILFENHKLIYVISSLIMFQWINEMSLVQYEIKKEHKIFKYISFINILSVLLTAISIYLSRFDFLFIILILHVLFTFLSFIKNLIVTCLNIQKKNYKEIFDLNIKSIAFLSSFSIIISSFAWRIIIYYIFDKSLAGIFFACFSIGSFPGTLFNAVIGPAFIKQNIILSKKFKNLIYIIFSLILIMSIVSIYIIYKQEIINYLGYEFILFTASISLVGSYFMSYAMYLRHKKIQTSPHERIYLFKTDILYGVSITFLTPLLYYVGGTIAVSFAFILASIIALIAYSINFSRLRTQ